MSRVWLALLPLPLGAHMVSISTGQVRIGGNHVHYELRMPLYEAPHIREPERSIFESLHFRSGGAEGRLIQKSCREDPGSGAYFCEGRYEFPEAVERLDVECYFHTVAVANHVHFLRAIKDAPDGVKTDQAVFDFSSPRATLGFAPPPLWDIVFRETGSGMVRAAGGGAQLLFLAALALASRSRRELAALAGAFVAGEIAACLGALRAGWQPAPQFVEAAAALTVGYLAVEILLFPKAGKRWLVAGALGAFHGLHFELFVRSTGYQAAYVLAGMAVAEAALIAVFALVLGRLARLLAALRPVPVSAALLALIGMAWFLRAAGLLP